MCVGGMLIALTCLLTIFIQIQLPISINGGLIHLGNVPFVIAAVAFGKRKGAIAGACGMALSDVLSPYIIYAPFTFVIRGVMGYVIGWIAEKKQGKSIVLNFLAVIVGGIIMIVGYYFAEALLYSNFYTPIASIPGNLIQILTAVILGLPLAMIVKKRGFLYKLY